jgi:phospho-N-acetylmuramoyl-pentapeptide-transferase
MTEVLKKSIELLFISTIVSIIFAPIMISFLYKFNQVSGIKKSKIGGGDGDNSLFMKIMKTTTTNGTPNMGGLMILVIVPILVLLFVPVTEVVKVFLIGFVLFGIWGLIDVVVFTNGFKNNEKMRAFQETFEWRLGKLLFSIMLNIGVMLLLQKTGAIQEVNITNSLAINFTPIIAALSGVVGQFAIYSAELTDGADGLMIGIMMIITVTFFFLLTVQQKYEFLPILAILLGVQIVDLYFNIPPARFWNGGPGAMPLGFTMFFLAIVTNNLIPYFFMSSITWVIMLSSLIQIVSMKFFNRRVFKIAPIHHHFQANGWPQYKVVMRFWLFTLATCIVGFYIGIL